MVVAMSILATAMLVLYQAASGATRNVRIDEHYAHAVVLAESLMVQLDEEVTRYQLPHQGNTASGYHWQISKHEMVQPITATLRLYQVRIEVSWSESASKERKLELHTVLAEAL